MTGLDITSSDNTSISNRDCSIVLNDTSNTSINASVFTNDPNSESVGTSTINEEGSICINAIYDKNVTFRLYSEYMETQCNSDEFVSNITSYIVNKLFKK